MEEFHVRTETVSHGRNRSMRHRFTGEASPLTGTTATVPAEITICKGIGRLLEFHYPGHPWSVEVNIEQGYAKVSIPDLLGPNWGWVILLSEMSDQLVIKAGGEILERFKIPRSTIDLARYVQIMDTLPLVGMYRARDKRLIPA